MDEALLNSKSLHWVFWIYQIFVWESIVKKELKSLLHCITACGVVGLTGCGGEGNTTQSYAKEIMSQEIMADINMSSYGGLVVTDGSVADYAELFIAASRLGGDTTDTVSTNTVEAYAQPAPNLTAENLDYHLEGDAGFELSFFGSNDSSKFQSGLGPVQNHNNCDACHPRDGRASMPYVPHKDFDDTMFVDENGFRKLRHSGVFLRISIENDQTKNATKSESNSWGAPVAVPNFSDQLFHRGSTGVRDAKDGLGAGQADVWLKYKTKTIRYPDGNTIELSRPYLFMDNPYDDPDDPMVFNDRAFSKDSKSALFRDDVKTGIRIGMPMTGLGLLGAIKEADILALADPDDADGDGISGKPNWVYDQEKANYCKPLNLCDQEQYKPISLGRYGWKANTPTVAHQGLGAMRGDMGVTNPLFPMESTAGTDLMRAYKAKNPNFKTYCDNNKTDADEEFSKSIVFYSETLAVPQRRDVNDAEVKRGGALFSAIGCVKCHTPSFVTASTSPSFSVDGSIGELTNQVIYPYTDMLLHDMGPDLADGREDFDATGSEWKTRPLWGVGLTQQVNPIAGFLHDGRARTLEEAIIWHGGEAEEIKVHFMKLSKSNRDAIVKFLESL